MDIEFDRRGNVFPYAIIEIDLEQFEKSFVANFNSDSTRSSLFVNYQNYLDALKPFLTHDFFQWVDGSFVTKKDSPKDIDLISVVHYEDYEVNKVLLEKEFSSSAARKNFGVDAYIVSNYPANHPKHTFTKSDLLYWNDLFGRTRLNRAKKQFKKGIIQIDFKSESWKTI
ncbi:MAG: hypothetical protein AAF798_04385 [Bacteroidota bacterium]